MEAKEQYVLKRHCKWCKEIIIFLPNPKQPNKYRPVNPDGSMHLCKVKVPTVFDEDEDNRGNR